MKAFIFLSCVMLLGCQQVGSKIEGYIPLARIVSGAYVSDEDYVDQQQGKIIQVWGYLGFSNISVQKDAIKQQPAWWDTPRDGEKPYFSLKAKKDNEAGESIRIIINGFADQKSSTGTGAKNAIRY